MLCGIVFLICIVTPHPAFIYLLSITEIDYTDLSCSITSAIILFGVFDYTDLSWFNNFCNYTFRSVYVNTVAKELVLVV